MATKEQIKEAILKADVVVFDIVHAQKEVTAALKILLKAEYEEEKTLIAVSSILSWADTAAPKPAEPKRLSRLEQLRQEAGK